MFDGIIQNEVAPEIPNIKPDIGSVPKFNSTPIPMPSYGAGPETSNNDVGSRMQDFLNTPTREAQLAPIPFDWDKSQMTRFQNSPHFKTYGANPEAGVDFNEEKFAGVQTAGDEIKRGIGGAVSGFVSGFVNQAKSIGNFATMFTDPTLRDSFQQNQLEEINKNNQDFDNNWHIFQGDNPTHFSSFMKAVQSTGPLLGAIGELAAETAVTNAAIVSTFGTAAGLEGIESLRWAKLAENATAATDGIIQSGIKADKIINNSSALGKTWATIGQMASKASDMIPAIGNTIGYTGDLAAYGAEGGTLATVGRGIGAFTNDMRGINLATSFASGNAAATYQQQVNDQITKYKEANNGQEPGYADMQTFQDNAMKVAKTDGAINSWGMLMLEKVAFGNILNNRKTLQDALQNSGREIFDRVSVKPSWVEGAKEEPLYIKQQAKWYDMKANYYAIPRELGVSAATHGVGFGLAMNTMSAIDTGIKSYYDAKYDNKDIDVFDAIRDGISSQFSKEGANTFISEFLNGALVMGLGGAALRKGVKAVTDRYSSSGKNTDKPAEDIQKDEQASEFTKRVNDLWKDPLNEVKSTLHNLILQNSIKQDADNSLSQNDRKGYHDVKDDADREFFLKLIRSGLADSWTDRMSEFSRSLPQEELCKLLEVENTPENYRDAINQILSLPGRVSDLRRIAREVDGKLGIPFNPYMTDPETKERLFKDGTPEFAVEVNNAHIFQTAKDYTIMLKDNAERGGIRRSDILNGKEGVTGIVDMPFTKGSGFSTIYTALHPIELDKQIAEYNQTLTLDKNNIYALRGKKVAETYRDTLSEFYDEYNEILNKGAYPERYKDINYLDTWYRDELTRTLHPYIEEGLIVRDVNGKIIDRKPAPLMNEVYDGVVKMIDYHKLGMEHDRLNKVLNVVLDPSMIRKYQMSFMKEGAYRQAESKEEPIPEEKPVSATPEPETTTSVPEKEVTPINTEPKPVVSDLEQQRKAVLKHYVTDGKETIPQIMNDHEQLEQIINAIQKVYKDHPEEKKQALEDAINEYFDKLSNISTPKGEHPELKGSPRILENGNKFIVKAGNTELPKLYDTILAANRGLQKYIDEHHPVVSGTEFRAGQHIYGPDGDFTIIQKGDKYLIRPFKKGTGNRDIPVTSEELAEDYSSVPRETGFDENSIKPLFKSSASVNIKPFIQDYDTLTGKTEAEKEAMRQAAADRVTELIKSIPAEHRTTGEGFSIVSEKSPNYTPGYKSNISPQIQQVALENFPFIEYKGIRIGSIDGSTIYTTPDKRELTAKQLTVKDIPNLFTIPDKGNYTTAQAILNRLRDNEVNSQALLRLIDGKSKVNLEGKVSFNTAYDFDFIKTDEVGPKLSELEGLSQGEHGLEMYVTNNYKEGEDSFVQSTMTSEDENRAMNIKPVGQLSYYTAIIKLHNGDMIPVQLTPREMTDDELDRLTTVISGISDSSKLQTANSELGRLFPALPVYSDEHWDKKGVRLDITSQGTGEDNYLNIAILQRIGKETISLGSVDIKPEKGTVLQFVDTDDLLNRLNKALKSDNIKTDIPELTKGNMKMQPDSGNIGDMEASVNKNIIKGTTNTFKVTDTNGEDRIVENTPEITTHQVSQSVPESEGKTLKQIAKDKKEKQVKLKSKKSSTTTTSADTEAHNTPTSYSFVVPASDLREGLTYINDINTTTTAIKTGVDESHIDLPDGKTKTVVIDQYLSMEKAERLKRDITAMVVRDMQVQKFPTYDKAIESILNKFQDSYDIDNPRNVDMFNSIENKYAREDWGERLTELHNVFSESESRGALKKNVQENLRLQGIKQSMIDEEENDIDEFTGNPFRDKSSVGGYSILDKDLRTWLSSVSIQVPDIGKTDEFGFDTHSDGTPVIQAVDTNIVYNGLLSLLSQSHDLTTNLNNILDYRDQGNNTDTCATISQWLSETGFDESKFRSTGEIFCSSEDGANFFNKLIKNFNQINTDYSSVTQDPYNNKVMVLDAGRRGPENNQLRNWSSAFYQNYYKQIEENIKLKQKAKNEELYRTALQPFHLIEKQVGSIAAKSRKISDNDLADLSRTISDTLQKSSGIMSLHPNYIAFSIISGKEKSARTENQESSLNMFPLAKPLNITDIKNILLPVLKTHDNPFTRSEEEVGTTNVEKLLLKLAKSNAFYDSTVDSTSHINSAGDPVFNYQYPSYNTTTVQKLNDPDFLSGLRSNPDTRSSYLLADPDFQSMNKALISVGGLMFKETYQNKEDNELQVKGSDLNKTGVDFSQFTRAYYDVFQLSLYDPSTNPDAYHKRNNGTHFYATPVSLGPIAEKSTHHDLYLPVKDCVKNGKPTDFVRDVLFNEVATETDRIKRVKQEIDRGKQAIMESGGEWIDGYHDGAERGLKLFTSVGFLDKKLVDTLEELAVDPDFNIEERKSDIHKAVDKSLMTEVKQYKQSLIQQELMTAGGKNNVLPQYLFKGLSKGMNSDLNLSDKDFDHNLAQVVINNYVNYVAGSRLMYGDKSKSSKSVEDWWKRMAGNNAQGQSFNSQVSTPESVPVNSYKNIIYPADKFTTIHDTTGEADDGQAYITAKGYKSFLTGLGRLSGIQKVLLNRAASGKDLTLKEFKIMHQSKTALGSLKPIYKDMETYLKCSSALLSRFDTSMRVGNQWVSLPGRDPLHDKLESAEHQEENGDVTFIGNKSISKAKSANIVQPGDEELSKYYTDIDAEFMRWQVATPMTSNIGNKSTQPAVQINASQDVKAPVYVNGEWKKAGDVIKDYMDANHQRVVNNLLSAVSENFEPISDIKDIDKVDFNTDAFQDNAIDTLKASGTDAQTIELYSEHYNINLPHLVEKSPNIFLSNFIKGVTKEKVPMWKMVLRSDTGMSVLRKIKTLTDDGQPKIWDIIPMEEYKKTPVSYKVIGQDDKFVGLGQGDVVVDRLRDVVPYYDDKGKLLYYYTEGLRPFMTEDEKRNGKFADALGYSFAARTPGTGFNSYRRVHWVDRLSDVLGNTAILSRDVMTATGQDNDGDSLFCANAATYLNNGQRTLYGTANTNAGKFQEYIQYQIDNNQQFRKLVYGDKFYSEDEAVDTLLGENISDFRKEQVLKELKLPSTVNEFMERGGDKLNNGVLTNQAFHAQLALLSGEHVSGGGKDALINRATSTKPIEDFAKSLSEELTTGESSHWARDIADSLSGRLGDMNSMLGQSRAYEAMQQGGEGIGGVANIIQTTAILNQFNKKVLHVPYTFDGKTFDEYRGAKNTPAAIRDRNVDIVAQIHVDATKDQWPSKLKITPEFASLIAHMVKLGQDLDMALLYPLTPPWQDYATKTQRPVYGSKGQPNIILRDMKQRLIERGAKGTVLTHKKMVNYIKSGKKDIDIELSLLDDLEIMRDITEPLRYLSRFMRFDTGRKLSTWEDIDHVGKGLDDLGVGMADDKFKKSMIPIDVRDIITSRHGNLSANYKVFKALDVLGKKVFIEKSETAKKLQDSILHKLNVPERDKIFHKILKHDAISYLSLTAYMKRLRDNGRQEVLNTLNHNLLWDNADSPHSIINIIQNLRSQLKGRDNNYALNSFLNTIIADKNTIINQVVANTWTRMSQSQQEKVVGSIVDMLSNKKGDIHMGALALFNYLLVKDGGQFKSGSFIRFIPTPMMKDWSDSMSRVVKTLGSKFDEKEYNNTFGKNYTDLINNFVDAQMTNVNNQKYVPDFRTVGDATPGYVRNEGKLFKLTDGHYNQVLVDGDSKQWKGAKAVFGNYPAPGKKTEAPEQPKEITNTPIMQQLLQEHGITTAFISNKGVFMKNGKEYPVSPGTSPRQLLEQLSKPVVSSQQIDWKSEIDKLAKGKGEGFLDEARNLYKSLSGKMPDDQILDKIKNCL